MTPAEIAARLTPAQKRVFMAAADAPDTLTFDERLALQRWRAKVTPPIHGHASWFLALPPFGWAVNAEPWTYTPLGQAVRAVLEQEQSDG